MPVPTSPAPMKQWTTALFEDRGAGLREAIQGSLTPVPTAAGNTDLYFIAPEDGHFHSADVSFNDALAQSDTNYVSFSMVNLGQNGMGVAEMLAPKNTKVTGGTAIVANGRFSLPAARGTSKVLAGDRLRFRVIGTGTLANQLGFGVVLLRFNP